MTIGKEESSWDRPGFCWLKKEKERSFQRNVYDIENFFKFFICDFSEGSEKISRVEEEGEGDIIGNTWVILIIRVWNMRKQGNQCSTEDITWIVIIMRLFL